VAHFSILTLAIISRSGTAEATVAKFCMQVEYINCLAFDKRGTVRERGFRWACMGSGSRFFYSHIFGVGEARHFKFRVLIDA